MFNPLNQFLCVDVEEFAEFAVIVFHVAEFVCNFK